MPNSLHERCLFLADMIGNMKERLAHDLRENVCACTGCCDGGCYYRTEKHKPWLMNLVETLSKKFKDHGNFFVNILFSPFILYKSNIAGNLGGVYYELLEDFMWHKYSCMY